MRRSAFQLIGLAIFDCRRACECFKTEDRRRDLGRGAVSADRVFRGDLYGDLSGRSRE
jgi:hypothetical protein